MIHLRHPTLSNSWGDTAYCGKWQSLNTKSGAPRSRFDVHIVAEPASVDCPRCLDEAEKLRIIREAMEASPDGFVIFCGACRFAGPFMAFCEAPISGELPPGQFRCPNCARSILGRVKQPTQEVF